MYTHQIERELSNVKTFRGAYPLNVFPRDGKLGSMVINLDTAYLPGSHWVVIIVEKERAIHFDSLQPQTIPMSLQKYFQKLFALTNKPIYGLKQPIQSIFSNTCAHHCINFIKIHLNSAVDDFYVLKRI